MICVRKLDKETLKIIYCQEQKLFQIFERCVIFNNIIYYGINLVKDFFRYILGLFFFRYLVLEAKECFHFKMNQSINFKYSETKKHTLIL